MSELLSVGLDVGTTTTQLILSRLTVENRANGFCVPQMEITQRQILYRSEVYFTPLIGPDRVDGEGIRGLVTQAYAQAGIRKEQVNSGAIIITGETSRKENAAAVLEALAGFAGEFVAATAGPDLESVLAAKGAGAVAHSEKTGETVLHMDVGGGTTNLALVRRGEIVATGCLNVGGRLIRVDKEGRITYLSPVLQGLTDLQVGALPQAGALDGVANLLTQALEMAAGLRAPTDLLHKLTTREAENAWQIPEGPLTLSFSGGVADCIREHYPPGRFGDIGVELGSAIGQSALCRGKYRLGEETIRATVIGAGCHSARLSGSTVFYRNVTLPLKNMPVASFTRREQDGPDLENLIAGRIRQADTWPVMLALPGYPEGGYEMIRTLAQRLLAATSGRGVYVCLEADMAKALGQYLSLILPEGAPCLCIDRVALGNNSFLDVGSPVGPALPVVVKTLVLERNIR